MSSPRVIPSIDQVLQRDALVRAQARHGHAAVAQAARQAADELRGSITAASSADAAPATAEAAGAWIEQRALTLLATRAEASLRPAINATGVIVHTNLGRAPLAGAALDAMAAVARGYANLEFDIDAGVRGHRHVHAERLLCALTGAEAALVVNNNAAAVMLVLAAVADGREAIVSRGELVEIGGGFRVPDVMRQSGAILREVGTTNRTRAADYAAAICDRTALLLRVHPSNFRVEGFTERPGLSDIAKVATPHAIPVFEDLGSGWLGIDDVETPAALADEPSVRTSLARGADLVAFSGDKLLGGPQTGIVLGKRDLVDRARRHPLMRAVRADKLTYAALEATLMLWATPSRRREIPVYRMLTMSVDEIADRARALAAAITSATITATIVDGHSTIGGGSAPQSALPTRLVAVTSAVVSAAHVAAALRRADPPIIARVEHDRVLIDLRTVAPEDDGVVRRAVRKLQQ
ncbi:MAG TPA: L-seryl-tRNA(Sec) selenium transferase [Vicinamibacterales bacterium]|nr:L-seryl-tRNA(Sec) selenium transferase [Vicinamibacterales bacterium]